MKQPARTPPVTIRDLKQQLEQLQKANQRLTISHQLTQEFVGHVKGVKHLIDMVFARVLETLDAEAGSLWLVDKRNSQNICHLAEGPAKKGVLGLRLPFGKGVVGAVIEEQEPVVVLDCSQDERFSKEVDSRTGFVTKSMICVPLLIDDESYGAIQIVNKKNGFNGQFDDDDCKLVMQLAAGASLSVKNARILEMESRVKEMNALMAISREIVSSLDLDQVLDYLVNKTNELVEITGGAVALWDEKQERLQLMTLSGGQKVDLANPSHIQLQQLMEQVKQSNRSSYVADVAQYKATLNGAQNNWVDYLEKHQLKAIWSMPLEDDEGVLGIVLFESDEAGFANGSKADMLHILASQATVALRNASLFNSIPFSAVLSSVGQKSQSWISGWKRQVAIIAIILSLFTALHYLPIFRWVSGPAIVEARLGRGVFAPLDGTLQQVLVKEGQRVEAGQTIAKLGSSSIKLSLLEAETQLALLERQMIEARAKSDAAAMNKAAIERESARAQVIKIRNDLTNIDIKSPMQGLVLTTKPQELAGRNFAQGDELFRLAEPNNLVLIVHVPETDLLDVKLGQTVKIVLRAQPGQYFNGKVQHVGRAYEIPSTALDPAAELEDSENQTGFIAEVAVEQVPFELRPGMTGQALIYTQQTSVISRIWRRIRNFIAFNLGL